MSENEPERVTTHVLDESGIIEVDFTRKGTTWSNDEPVTLHPGAVLDFDRQITLRNGESISFVWNEDVE